MFSAARREGRAQTWLLAVLAAAAILGPAEQAWLHTAALLNEHVGVGAWFAAIAAGYAADRFIAAAPAGRQQVFTSVTCVIALVFPVYLGAAQSQVVRDQLAQRDRVHRGLPAAGRAQQRADAGRGPLDRQVLPAVRPGLAAVVQHPHHHPALRGHHRDPAAAAGSSSARQRRDLRLATSPMGYFSYVALNFTDTTALDHGLATELHHNPRLPHHRGHPLRHRGQAGWPGHLRNLEIRAPALTEVPGSVHALPADSGS